jgi:8-oxo-dGTP pyrophosphatase MutT (NUDIX family)
METRQISSELVYENRWMRVREDQVRRPDGSEGIFGVVEKDVGGRFMEFPQGSWEDRSGVDPEMLARAELAEETGLVAGSLDHVGHLYEAYGYCNQGFDVWIATDLERGEPRRSVEEQGMEVCRVTRAEWRNLLAGGRVKDAPSVAAYGLLTLYEAGELDAG